MVERRLCKVKVCDGVGVPLLGEDVENVVEISCKLFDIFDLCQLQYLLLVTIKFLTLYMMNIM